MGNWGLDMGNFYTVVFPVFPLYLIYLGDVNGGSNYGVCNIQIQITNKSQMDHK
jgi:hypothetical protein